MACGISQATDSTHGGGPGSFLVELKPERSFRSMRLNHHAQRERAEEGRGPPLSAHAAYCGFGPGPIGRLPFRT